MATELKQSSPGGALMADHLAQIMLLQVLRLWLACGKHPGWLGALADPRLTRAIGAMQADPARRWTLAELASLAADRLHRSAESVARIGFSVGYEAEAAFSSAFRRQIGCTPMQHRRMPQT